MKILFLIICIPSLCICQPNRLPISVDELAIQVPAEGSREFAYSNKQSGVFYSETNGSHRSAWQGWRIMSNEILDDYELSIDDQPLVKENASAVVYPHQLIRSYPDGIKEIFSFLDSINAFVVELENVRGNEMAVSPYFPNSIDSNDYEILFEENVLLIASKKRLHETTIEDYPEWIGITASNCKDIKFSIDNFIKAGTFTPACLRFTIDNPNPSIIFVAGDDKSETISLAHNVFKNYGSFINDRKKRMEELLNRSYVRSNNKRFDKALYWAKLSLDALIMNQRGKGIFAGLPWFDDYWGRDTFISLPGATLVTGNFKDAKDILKSFAAWQDTNPYSANYGRIPNLVTTNSISYNTADGTPRFIIALNEYFLYSSDTAFAREMYPIVKRSIDGTIKYHMDSLCFLTHGDAETWMDAVGADGPWSSRGNRANDVQALWSQQLAIGMSWSMLFNSSNDFNTYSNILQKLKDNFSKYFINHENGIPYDHLTIDGTPNQQLRPNLLFEFPHVGNTGADVFEMVTKKLVYPYGVASLSQDDDNFHPYHHYEPYYVPDAAYHNGVVWTWLAGKWIDMAAERSLPNLAFTVTDNMVHEILDRGAVGTISELLDASPRQGESEPRISGAFSQAWSLAEFIRSFYQSYLGIIINNNKYRSRTYELEDKMQKVTIHPSLPTSITSVDFDVNAGAFSLRVFYSKSNDETILKVKSYYQPDSIAILFIPENESLGFLSDYKLGIHSLDSSHIEMPEIFYHLKKNSTLSLNISKHGIMLSGANVTDNIYSYATFPSPNKYRELNLAIPIIRKDLKCLQPPSYRLLSNFEIKRSNPNAKILYDVLDPEGDDNGNGNYIYPLTPYLKVGSLDITRFTVSYDTSNIYFHLKFRNLSNPGWHPEYGFQLTYAAVAIETTDVSGSTNVSMNSNYIFTNGFKFQTIIFIGGGIRIVGESGKIIAEYIPVSDDVKNPLGKASNKSIEFSIPTNLMSIPDTSWRFAVLIGAQDDHGGAGIGEFRSVESAAKEWVGGGKVSSTDPNVYDFIIPNGK